MNEEQYQEHLAERGQQWDKYLKDKKNKNISKESQIEMRLKEANVRKAEEMAKQSDGKFYMQVRVNIYILLV